MLNQWRGRYPRPSDKRLVPNTIEVLSAEEMGFSSGDSGISIGKRPRPLPILRLLQVAEDAEVLEELREDGGSNFSPRGLKFLKLDPSWKLVSPSGPKFSSL